MVVAKSRKAKDIIENPQFNVFKVVDNPWWKAPLVFSSFEEFEIAAESYCRDRGWHLEGRD